MDKNKSVREFYDFLEQHRVTKVTGKPSVFTHTSLGNPLGSFYISDDDKNTFIRLYKRILRTGLCKVHLTEKHFAQGPIVIDIDIKYKNDSNERIYIFEDVLNVINSYNKYIKEFIDINDDDLNAYLIEKDKPTHINENNYKDGFHIMYPNICTKPILQHLLRENVLGDFKKKKYFENLNLTNTLEDVFDKAVIEKNNWMMYGSCKPDCYTYKLTKIIDINGVECECDVDDYLIDDLSIQKFTEEDITKTKISEEKIIKLYNDICPTYSKIKLNNDVNIRTAQILVGMLKDERADNYETWITLGFCLHNIDNTLLDLWIEFSKKNSKFKDGECEKFWNNFRNDGYTIKSLHKWARDDNPEEYSSFMLEELSIFFEKSLEGKGTSYDVAKAFFELYKYDFAVSSISHKIWYYFDGNKWIEMDCAYKIIQLLNEEMVNQYLKMATGFSTKATLASGSKKDKMIECNSACLAISIKLRQTSFKKSVIEELLTLYYDPQFNNKLDEYRHLLCFNNGVYDMELMTFRQGRPEDYISLCTNINYIPYDEDDFTVKEVYEFFKSILPEDDLRAYVLKFLGSCLAGNSPDEKIHIWTGSGSNGKSLLINLMQLTIGAYATTLSISLLTQKRAASNAATPEIADAKGKRFAVFQEPDNNDSINVGFMKELTGNDKIKARKLFRDPIEFYPQFKPVLTCNRLPNIPSNDGGTWRRIRVTPFEMKFVDNPKEDYEKKIDRKLKEKLPLWKEAFMSILIHHYSIYRFEGIAEPDKVLLFTKRYESESDLYADFVNGMLEKSEDEDTSILDLWKYFSIWYKHRYTEKFAFNVNHFKHEIEDKLKTRVVNDMIKGFKIKSIVDTAGKIVSTD
jgi:P4 family phage/plasmid primase-like protien